MGDALGVALMRRVVVRGLYSPRVNQHITCGLLHPDVVTEGLYTSHIVLALGYSCGPPTKMEELVVDRVALQIMLSGGAWASWNATSSSLTLSDRPTPPRSA